MFVCDGKLVCLDGKSERTDRGGKTGVLCPRDTIRGPDGRGIQRLQESIRTSTERYYAFQLHTPTSKLVRGPAGTGKLVVLTRGHGRATRWDRRHADRLRTVVCDAGRARFRRRCGSEGGGGGKASRAVGTGKGLSLEALAGGGTVDEMGCGMLWGTATGSLVRVEWRYMAQRRHTHMHRCR